MTGNVNYPQMNVKLIVLRGVKSSKQFFKQVRLVGQQLLYENESSKKRPKNLLGVTQAMCW